MARFFIQIVLVFTCSQCHSQEIHAPVQVIFMTESSTSIQVRWKPPLNSVQSELSYQLNYTNGDIYNTRNTYHKFDGLNPHTEYKIWVRTELNGKEGMMSEPAVGIVETFKEVQCNANLFGIGSILGGLILGFIAILIMVVIMIKCHKRNRSHEEIQQSRPSVPDSAYHSATDAGESCTNFTNFDDFISNENTCYYNSVNW